MGKPSGRQWFWSAQNGGSPAGTYALYINEFMASNDTITFPDMAEDYTPDWIEIYNDSDRWVSLEGFEITDDLDGEDNIARPQHRTAGLLGAVCRWRCRSRTTSSRLQTEF